MQRSKIEGRRPRRVADEDGEVREAAVGGADGGAGGGDFWGAARADPD